MHNIPKYCVMWIQYHPPVHTLDTMHDTVHVHEVYVCTHTHTHVHTVSVPVPSGYLCFLRHLSPLSESFILSFILFCLLFVSLIVILKDN